MASISVNFGASDAYTVAVEWAVAAQDTAQNQTTLDLTCTLRSNRASATFTGQARSDTLTIGGQSYACSHGAYTVPGGGSVTLWTLRAAVSHDADGSFSKAVACTVGIGTTFSSSGYIDAVTASGTMTLPAIPRASALSFGAFTAGSAGTIAIQAASSAFTHNLSYTFGGKSGTVASGVKGSVSWTPPLSLLTEIPNATQGSGTLTCTTLLSGAAVGTKTAAFTLYAPDSVRPTVTAAEVAVVNDNAVAAAWGVAIRGLSKLRWSASAAGAYGSTVQSWAFACGGVTGSASSGTTAVLPGAGTFTPTVTVTDSRGRTGSRSAAAVEVLDYAPPVVKTASAVRCDESGAASDQGTYCRLNLTASCSSVGGRNSLTLRCRTKPTGGTFSGWTALTDGMVLSGFAVGQSYVVELSAVDALGGTRTVSISVPTAAAAFHLREGGQGAAFGKYAEEDDLLDVAWAARVRKALRLDVPLEPQYGGTGKSSAADAANALINALSAGSAAPVDADYYVSQYSGGGTTTTTYHRRPMSALWSYIKGKIGLDSNGILPASKGGTGASTAAAAVQNLFASGSSVTSYPTKPGIYRTTGTNIFKNMTPYGSYGVLIIFKVTYAAHFYVDSYGNLYYGYSGSTFAEPSKWYTPSVTQKT